MRNRLAEPTMEPIGRTLTGVTDRVISSADSSAERFRCSSAKRFHPSSANRFRPGSAKRFRPGNWPQLRVQRLRG